MDALVLITMIVELIAILIIIFGLYKFLMYIGYQRSILALSVIAHFAGGYLMFFS